MWFVADACFAPRCGYYPHDYKARRKRTSEPGQRRAQVVTRTRKYHYSYNPPRSAWKNQAKQIN